MAEVFAYGPIDETMVGDLRRAISKIPKREPIELHINSPGGILGEGVVAYNLLRRAPQEVHASLDGDAFSAATLLVCAADYADMASNTLMMIHDPWVPWGGALTLMQADRTARYLTATKEQALEIYAAKTGRPRQALSEWMEAETYFDARLALEVGFVNNISDASRQVLNKALEDYDAHDKDRLAKLLADRPVPRHISDIAAKHGVKLNDDHHQTT